MYYGKMTPELNKLYEQYVKVWGHNPEGYLGVEYDQDDYDLYVSDIKEALEKGIELESLYPDEDDFTVDFNAPLTEHQKMVTQAFTKMMNEQKHS